MGFWWDFCATFTVLLFCGESCKLILRSRNSKGGIIIPEIFISIRDKLPVITGPLKHVVSDNTDYTVRFLFDSEWDGLSPKTVFFADGASGENMPVVMDGDTCVMPLISDWHTLLIGVQAGELHTTQPAVLPVFPSIARQMGDTVPPEEFDKWTQIMERLLSPAEKTAAMTQAVGRDADGKLWTEPTGGGGGSDPDAVTYTQQDGRTVAEKAQARENIDAGTLDEEDVPEITNLEIEAIIASIGGL